MFVWIEEEDFERQMCKQNQIRYSEEMENEIIEETGKNVRKSVQKLMKLIKIQITIDIVLYIQLKKFACEFRSKRTTK